MLQNKILSHNCPFFTVKTVTTVFDRSNVEITGSNPARGMDVFVSLCCVVLCVSTGLALG
jgi:hypothetical protein